MKKFLLSSLFLFVVIFADAQLVPYKDLTIKNVRSGETAFAIVKDGKALYGPDAQNLGYDTYSIAYAKSNVWTSFKLESLANNPDASDDIKDGFLLRAYNAAGEAYTIWEDPGYLNSQPADGWCSFVLGLKNQFGQDIKNGAVWYIEPGDDGYALMNAGTGLYLDGNATANSATPVYYKFKSMGDVVDAMFDLIAEAQKYEDTDADVRSALIYAVEIWDTPATTYEQYLAAIDQLNATMLVASSISDVKSQQSSDAIFNIAGQRVDANYKGVIIKNGKKYIKK